MRVSFVILHYLAPEMTMRCIGLLRQNFAAEGVQLVVVDNASPDGSGPALMERCRDMADVHFVLLHGNKGFAQGNNAGYRYAVEHFDPDFIVVMNNDVLIEDPSFIDRIYSEYAEDPFAVLGPDIWAPEAGRHQSPTKLLPMTEEKARELRRIFRLKDRFYAYQHYSWKLKQMLGLARTKQPEDNEPDKPHTDCVLHGACYIFSRDFISRRRDAFNPSTFLYMEEDILHLECRRDSLRMRYCPSLKVTHLEDVSTNAAFKSGYRRNKVKYKRMVDSLDIFIALMQGQTDTRDE